MVLVNEVHDCSHWALVMGRMCLEFLHSNQAVFEIPFFPFWAVSGVASTKSQWTVCDGGWVFVEICLLSKSLCGRLHVKDEYGKERVKGEKCTEYSTHFLSVRTKWCCENPIVRCG